MRTSNVVLRALCGWAGVLLVAGMASPGAWAAVKDVKGIDVVVKKQPTGKGYALVATTDASGTVRFRLPEAGTYELEICHPGAAQPDAAPQGAFVIRVEGQARAISKPGIGARIAMDSGSTRTRLYHPGIPFDNWGQSHTEIVTVADTTDVMLRLTVLAPDANNPDPALVGLPQHMSFIGVEGAASPLPQTIELASEMKGAWLMNWVPSAPGGPLVSGKSAGTIGDTGDSILLHVDAAGKKADFYSGSLEFRRNAGDAPQVVPVYVRILPAAQLLPPIGDKKMLYYPAGVDTQVLTLTNRNSAAETYSIENQFPADAARVTFSPPRLTIAPGATGTVTVTFLKATGNDKEPQKCAKVTRPDGTSFTYYLLKPDVTTLPTDTTGTGHFVACFPTMLYPVLVNTDTPAAAELDMMGTVQVYDDCGNLRPDAGVKATNTVDGRADFTTGNGVKDVKVGLGKHPPAGTASIQAYALDPQGNEISGDSGPLGIDPVDLPALDPAAAPVTVYEIVNATSGEPTALAPGMTAYIKTSSKAPPTPGAATGDTLDPNTVTLGYCVPQPDCVYPPITNLTAVPGGWTFDVPAQSTATAYDLVIRTGPTTLGKHVDLGPAAPQIVMHDDGTVQLWKHHGPDDLEGEDYAMTGGDPPVAGDLVSIRATGLGMVDGDGMPVNPIQLLVGNGPVAAGPTPATPNGIRPCPPWCPRSATNGAQLYFIMPDLAAGDDGASQGPAPVQMLVGGITSNNPFTPTVGLNPNLGGIFFVQTAPAGLTVQVNGSSFTYVPPQPFVLSNAFHSDSTGNASFDVPVTQQFLGTNTYVRYDFTGWSFGGATLQTRKVSGGSNVTANFNMMVKLTITGGTITNASADGFYPEGAAVYFTANCPAGQVFDYTGVVTRSDVTGNVVFTFSSNGLGVIAVHPEDITVNCKPGAASTVQVTANTNLTPGQGFVMGITAGTASGSSSNVFAMPVPPGPATVSVTPASKLSADGLTRWDFSNSWSVNGTPNAALINATQAVTVPVSNTTYTANMRTLFQITQLVSGSCTAIPTTAFYPANSNQTVVVNLSTGATLTSIVFTNSSGVAQTLTNNSSLTLASPGTLTVTCSTVSSAVPVTVTSAPIGLKVQIDNATEAVAPQTANWTAGSAGHSVGTSTPQADAAGTTYYSFSGWSPAGPSTPTWTIAVAPAAATTYTANFFAACYVLTLTPTPAAGGTAAVNPASGGVSVPANCFIPGTVVTLTSQPAAGYGHNSFGGDVVGTNQNTVSVTMSGPKNVKIFFDTLSSIPVTVNTAPAAIGATVGISTVTGINSATATLPGGSQQTVTATQPTLISSGSQYTFQNWTPAGPNVQLPASGTATYTANYKLTGFVVTVTTNGGCSITGAVPPYVNPWIVPINSTISFGVNAPNGTVVNSVKVLPPGPGATFQLLTGPTYTYQVLNPSTIAIDCGPPTPYPVKVSTNPANKGLQVLADTTPVTNSAGFTWAGQHSIDVPQKVQQLGGIEYSYHNWTLTPPGSTIVQAPVAQANVTPTAPVTYTANFDETAFQVTLVNNGCTSFTTTPGIASGAYVTAGSLITGLNVLPLSGAAVKFDFTSQGQPNTYTVPNLAAFNGFPIGGPTTITATCPTNVTLTLDTVPPGLGGRINGGSFASSPITKTVTSGVATPVEVNPIEVLNGTGYAFGAWTSGPVQNTGVSATNATTTVNATVTATFKQQCTVLTLAASPAAGGTVTANPASGGLAGFPANCYPYNQVVTLTAVPSANYTFTNWTGATGPSTTTVSMTAPLTVTANFGQATNVPITVATNPTGLKVQIDNGSALTAPQTASWLGGSTGHSVGTSTPQADAAGTTYYSFTGWSPSGPTTATWPITTAPTSATTYTANFTPACYVLTLTPTPAAGGTAALNPAAGNVTGAPANCYAPGTVVTLTSQPATGYQHNSFGGDVPGTSSTTTTVTMSGAKNVKIFFDLIPYYPVTITTSPLGLAFSVDNSPFTNTVTQQWAYLSPHKLEVTTPQALLNSYYAFQKWSIVAGTVSNSALYSNASVSKSETYTANFATLCHLLTVNATGGTVTRSPASGGVTGAPTNCYVPGTVVTLTPTGTGTNTFTGWTGDATGTANPLPVTISGPKTINAAFGTPSNVTLTVATNPSFLDARIGTSGAYTGAPVSLTITANTTATVSVTDPIVKNGIGYKFANWTNALPANSATATATIGTSNVTATANFNVACYVVTITTAGNGTVAPNPLSGGVVAGFPAGCYSPGSIVRMNNTPGANDGLKSIVVTQPSGTQTYTSTQNVTISGPTTVVVTFQPRPGLSTVANQTPTFSNGVYSTNVTITNTNGAAGTNLRITAATFTQAGVAVTSGLLPISYGNVPANSPGISKVLTYTIPASVASGTNFVMALTVEVTNSQGDVLQYFPTIGQLKP